MLGSKGFLTPLIPDCYVLCTPAIFMYILYHMLSFSALNRWFNFFLLIFYAVLPAQNPICRLCGFFFRPIISKSSAVRRQASSFSSVPF